MPEVTSDKTYALLETPHSRKIISELECRGGKVIAFPFVAPENLDVEADLAALFERSGSFDWLVLTDLWAVDIFLAALQAIAFELYELDDVRILAVGEAVADRLRFVQLHADVIPPRVDSETVVSAAAEYEGGHLSDVRALVVEGRPPRDDLAARLTAAGAKIESFPVYRFAETAANSIVKLKALLLGGAVDEFIFASPEEVLCCEKLFGPAKLNDVFQGVTVAAVSEQVFQSLVEQGLRPRFYRAK